MKPRLISFDTDVNQLFLPELRPWLADSFEFGTYDSLRTYDTKSTVFVVNQYQYAQDQARIDALIDSGYRCIFENLLEIGPMPTADLDRPGTLHLYGGSRQRPCGLENPQWIWIWSYLMYRYRWPQDLNSRRYDAWNRKFLLLMKELRPFRTDIFNCFQPILDQGLYSYVARGHVLPAGLEPMTPTWEFQVNTEWYNRTAVSVVVETNMFEHADDIFITEKTYKPIMMGHPWVILSSPGAVALLKTWGFESFDNLFEETYDQIAAVDRRIYHAYMAIKYLNIDHYDAETLRRIQHNQQQFGNETKQRELLQKSLIDPVIEWVHSESA